MSSPPSPPVYRRVGRGGAGNYFDKTTVKEATPVDIEAQAAPPKQTSPTPAGTSPLTTSFVDSIYKTIGRGGAGNWFSPIEDAIRSATQGTASPTSSASPASSLRNGSVSSTKLPEHDPSEAVNTDSPSRIWAGRGGAGNWEADQDIKRRESKLVEGMEQEMQDMSRREAEAEAIEMIPKPTHAHLHKPLKPVQDHDE